MVERPGPCGGQVGCPAGGIGYPDQAVAVPVPVVGDVDAVVRWGGGECLRPGQFQVLVIDAVLDPGAHVVDRPGQIGFPALVLPNGMGAGERLGFVEVGGVAAAGAPERCSAPGVAAAVLEIEEVAHGVTRLNSMTQTQGLAVKASGPLISPQRERNQSQASKPLPPVSHSRSAGYPSARACSSLMSCSRSTRTAVS